MLCDYVSSVCNSARALAEEPSPCFREKLGPARTVPLVNPSYGVQV